MTWQTSTNSQRLTILRHVARHWKTGDSRGDVSEIAELPAVATRKIVADFTGISMPTLARWAVEGKGPRFRKAGSRCLYLREDVLRWLESLESGGGRA